jgi:hypothetical protein
MVLRKGINSFLKATLSASLSTFIPENHHLAVVTGHLLRSLLYFELPSSIQNNVKLGLAIHMEALLRALALRRKNLGMKTILELSYVFHIEC